MRPSRQERDQVAILFVVFAALSFGGFAFTIYGVVKIAFNAFGG